MNTIPFTSSSLRTEQGANVSQVDTPCHVMDTPSRNIEGGNPLLTDREAGEYLRLCPRQLYAMRRRGLIPFVKIGRRTIRYRLRDLDAAIETMTVVAQPDARKRSAPAVQSPSSPSPEFAALFTPNTHE